MNETWAKLKYGSMFAAATIATVGGLCWPANRRVAAAQTALNETRQRLALAGDDADRLLAAQARLERLLERGMSEIREIPAGPDLPGLMERISQTIASLPLEGQTFTRGGETTIGTRVGVGLNVETAGRFDGVFELLRRVEALPRLVRVREVRVQRPAKDALGRIEATVSLEAFYDRATAAAPATGEAWP